MTLIATRLGEIAAAVGGKIDPAAAEVLCKGVAIDSRSIGKGDLFVAIVGERVDGNNFAADALQEGASACMISKNGVLPDGAPWVLVEDTVMALGKLAGFNRSRFNLPVIGVTGSNGKTTTKDMLAAILEQEHPIVKTEGNQNNEIGMPMTLLRLDHNHHYAVVEMGMRGLGQIEQLASIARPTVGVVTNVGETHIELLGSKEQIALAKSELVKALPNDGIAVLNGDDSLVRSMAAATKAHICYYGLNSRNDVWAESLEDLKEKGYKFTLCSVLSGKRASAMAAIPLPGAHNVMNALAAAAAALSLGIEMDSVVRGLSEFVPTAMRMQVVHGKLGITLLNDAYNASPASMNAALNTLDSIGAGKRTVAVLADMLELGKKSEELHMEVGKFAASTGLDLLVTVGEKAKFIAQGFNLIRRSNLGKVETFSTRDEAVEFLVSVLKGNEIVLVKGSRGMKMEEVVKSLV